MRASAIKGVIDINKDLFTKALRANDEMQKVYKEGLHEQTTKFLNGDFIALDLKNLKVDKVVEICKLLYDISQKAVVIGAAD